MSWQTEVYATAMKCLIPPYEVNDIERLIDKIIVEDLTERQAEILFARFEAKQSFKDIAEDCKLDYKTIYGTVTKALGKIKLGVEARNARNITDISCEHIEETEEDINGNKTL